MLNLLLYLDQTPEYSRRKQPRTWTGVIVTLLSYGFVASMGTYFLILYFTESNTQFVNNPTLGNTYNVRFRCVSIAGCNVTYEYEPTSECGGLASMPGAIYAEGEEFVLEVCRARSPKEGVRVRTSFDRNDMWITKNVLWSVELNQNGEFIPLGEVEQNRVKVVRLRNTAVVDRSNFRERPRMRGSFWTDEPTSTVLFDNECFTAGTPGGFICGSIQFTLSELFVTEEKRLSNTLRADVVAPTFAVLAGVGLLMGVIVWAQHKTHPDRVYDTSGSTDSKDIEVTAYSETRGS